MKPIANPEPEKVIARASECLRRLMDAGLSFDALQVPISDPIARERLVKYWVSGTFENGMSRCRAKEVMGKDYFGFDVTHPEKHFGEQPDLIEVPWKPDLLERAAQGSYLLVAVPPISLQDVEILGYEKFWPRIPSIPATQKKLKAGWYLLAKSTRSLGAAGKHPPAALLAYANLMYYARYKKYLYEGEDVVCASDGAECGMYLSFKSKGISGRHIELKDRRVMLSLDHVKAVNFVQPPD